MKLFGYVPMSREAMLAKHRHENWIRYRDANHRVLELQKENADLRAKIEELTKRIEQEKAPTGIMCDICNQDSSLCKNHLTTLRYQVPQQPKKDEGK